MLGSFIMGPWARTFIFVGFVATGDEFPSRNDGEDPPSFQQASRCKTAACVSQLFFSLCVIEFGAHALFAIGRAACGPSDFRLFFKFGIGFVFPFCTCQFFLLSSSRVPAFRSANAFFFSFVPSGTVPHAGPLFFRPYGAVPTRKFSSAKCPEWPSASPFFILLSLTSLLSFFYLSYKPIIPSWDLLRCTSRGNFSLICAGFSFRTARKVRSPQGFQLTTNSQLPFSPLSLDLLMLFARGLAGQWVLMPN